MNADFIQEIIEEDDTPRLLGGLTGWEVVVFEVEDEPPRRHPERSEGSQAS